MGTDWRVEAEKIVGARPAEFDPEWHEAKIRLIQRHLERAYAEGVRVAEERCLEKWKRQGLLEDE